MRSTHALTLLGALAALIAAKPARAEWKGAVWGETPAQADRSFTVTHHALAPERQMLMRQDVTASVGMPLFAFSYQDQGFAFRQGELAFRRGGLFSIRMELADGGQCQSFANAMLQAYGNPVRDRETSFDAFVFGNRSVDWEDPAHNNAVHLQVITHANRRYPDRCILSLYPLGVSQTS